ncbi:COR domain-containing protein [Thiothrix subterranea]|uniref:COR domain-containing protein n=1 Tax=Thiothrix subterranea TaxID=2735563 RepID=A0AA51MMQ0_9GAMM|nr:COR domain-containing protein [Thiothrix subterranea]MDQ5768081.1 COR domain-containing protein [Thiothrix subterranea]WML85157.1 COR domain-containing protein [Thiothrix subterranea]
MAELPTEEELEKLYHEKGHDALVWYAWRNALRVLPLFQLGIAWRRNTVVRYAYMVCRPSLVLAQWANILTEVKFFDTQSAAEAIAYAEADDFHNSTAASAAVNAVNTAVNTAANTCAASAVAAAANAANLYYDASLAITDYTFLLHNNKSSVAFWYSQPLWTGDDDRTVIAKWRQSFDSDLRELGLDFLADDLNDLWEGRPLGTHAKNYLQDLSETITNDPEWLRRAILFGETTENVHAVRALLLGPGGAGKSSLADRLQSKPISQTKKLTVGVDYLNHQPLNLYENFSYLRQGEKPLDLYLWDFGGQTIFHGLHSAFLHENCVYVLVVDSRHEQVPDEWLHQIRHLAGSQAKVLLVTNWYEACETRQNEARLLREFPDLLDNHSFFYFSCHEPESLGFRTFVEALEQASLASQRMVLKETLDVNEALQQRYQDDVFLESVELDEIIEQVTQRIEAIETLPNKLEQLGFLVRVDSDDQRYCLKPAWAVDHAYAVLYSPTLREAKGVLQLKTLQRDFKDKINAQHTAYLVEFLQTRSLCRKLPNGGGYFFPDAASADELPEASELLSNTSSLVIRFELPYLPLGFHAALVYRLFTPDGITTPDDIWRQGFILRKNTSRAVVHYLSRKSIVEMALVGELQDFSSLLSILLVNMKAVLTEGKGGIHEEQIHPSVVLDRHVFSVHSGERLVDVLGQINSYGQLIHEVKAMASKNIINNYAPNQGNQAGEQIFNDQSSAFTQEIKAVEIAEKWYKQWWVFSVTLGMITSGLAGFWLKSWPIAIGAGVIVGYLIYLLNTKRRFWRGAMVAFGWLAMNASPSLAVKLGWIDKTSDNNKWFLLESGEPLNIVVTLAVISLIGWFAWLDHKQG